MIDPKATAIFGGAFDPPHHGHIQIARALLAFPGIDSIMVVPACRPPHKFPVAPFRDRLEMCLLAMPPGITVVNEDNEESITYSCDTFPRLPLWGKHGYTIVLGSDEVRNLGTWKAPERLFGAASLLIVDRSGDAIPSASKIEHSQLHPVVEAAISRAGRLELATRYAISSTEIRNRIQRRDGTSENLVPKQVWHYIREHKLYGFEEE